MQLNSSSQRPTRRYLYQKPLIRGRTHTSHEVFTFHIPRLYCVALTNSSRSKPKPIFPIATHQKLSIFDRLPLPMGLSLCQTVASPRNASRHLKATAHASLVSSSSTTTAHNQTRSDKNPAQPRERSSISPTWLSTY